MPRFLPGTWRVVRLPESSATSNDPEFEKEYRSYLMSWKNSSENFHAIQKSSSFSKENQRRSITSPGPAIACLGEDGESPAKCAEKSDRMLLEDNRRIGRRQLLCLHDSRARCQPRECSSIQSADGFLVAGNRHAAEKSGRHSPDRVGSSRSSKDRGELPW
jgi:hypothetical protein